MSIKSDISSASEHFACAYCNELLEEMDDSFFCRSCNQSYNYLDDGRIDLRLKRLKQQKLTFKLEPDCYREAPVNGMKWKINPDIVKPDDKLTKVSRYMLSELPTADNDNALSLDIGCGAMPHRVYIERAGYQYIGFDCDDPQASIIGDAHAIPFPSEHFDLATSYATFEHFRYPPIVMNEVFRTLKPGGYLHGWVAFIEGFHDSYFHMTHWGIGSLLKQAGFQIVWLEPDRNSLWHIVHNMFPRFSESLIRKLIAPVYLMHRLWFKIGNLILNRRATSEEARKNLVPGGIMFLVRKPE
ncbi:class I SAM-dependent methyltransferase [bacterium]|nr:class I SAM-dependent methyltransferase [bacterium]